MKVNDIFLNITSEDPQRLIAFYRDVVGLAPRPEMGEGALAMGAATLGFDGHSATKGAAKEPSRYLLNFFVDNVDEEQQRLENLGVTFIRKQGHEYWGGIISTFVDPDGNYAQIIEYRPQSNEQ